MKTVARCRSSGSADGLEQVDRAIEVAVDRLRGGLEIELADLGDDFRDRTLVRHLVQGDSASHQRVAPAAWWRRSERPEAVERCAC